MSIGDGRMLLSIQSLVIISRAFLDGKKLPSDLELAEELGCSSVVLKPALDALEGAQIISRGETRDAPITLARSPHKIQLDDIREALFKGSNCMHFPAHMARLFNSFATGGKNPGTLADIVHLEGN